MAGIAQRESNVSVSQLAQSLDRVGDLADLLEQFLKRSEVGVAQGIEQGLLVIEVVVQRRG